MTHCNRFHDEIYIPYTAVVIDDHHALSEVMCISLISSKLYTTKLL